MLNLYISHAPGDRQSMEKLLRWIKPLQEKYFLHVWFDHPMPPPRPWPLIWQLLLFWVEPRRNRLPYHPDLRQKVQEGHIYLFLTSYNALATPHINQIEIPAAAERSIVFGPDFVRVYPILVAPSKYKEFSRLGGYPVLGPSSSLVKTDPEEEGYAQIVSALEPIIVELRTNWIEDYHQRGMSTDAFFQHAPPELDEPEFTPLPDWMGWVILLAILFFVTSWFTTYCAPKQYYKYKPEVTPYESPPERYLRDYPVQPMPDTASIPPQEEENMMQSGDSTR
ncbi:MAG: hypothetical protein IPL65_17290 [Lewinellaceae bacterium]|nr:hypothetical protein [Lewinellaceae bacterium]